MIELDVIPTKEKTLAEILRDAMELHIATKQATEIYSAHLTLNQKESILPHD